MFVLVYRLPPITNVCLRELYITKSSNSKRCAIFTILLNVFIKDSKNYLYLLISKVTIQSFKSLPLDIVYKPIKKLLHKLHTETTHSTLKQPMLILSS